MNGFIEKACLNAEHNRKLCELICADSRKLFQRWPPEVLSRTTASGPDLKKNAPEGAVGGSSRESRTPDDDVSLTEEEARTLAEVEHILAKAQQARKLQEKVGHCACKHSKH